MKRRTAPVVLAAAVLLASVAVPGNAAPLAAPAVSLVGDTLLDSSALYFVSYDGVVNNNSFQQDAIVTYMGRQYATWYTGSRNAVIARRSLGSTRWDPAKCGSSRDTGKTGYESILRTSERVYRAGPG